MPSFQISDPTAAVSLSDAEEGGQAVSRGNVVFAVENLTTLKRTATVAVAPESAADAEHYRIEGATPTGPTAVSLDFAPRQTQNVRVGIAAKRGAEPASCAFRLRVTLETDPDNDVAESRPVAFTVPAQAVAAPPKPGFPWIALAVAAVLILAVVGVGLAFIVPGLGGGQTEEPPTAIEDSLKNQTLDYAKGVVTGAGLTPVPRIGQRDGIPVNQVYEARRDPGDPNKMILYYDPGVAGLKGTAIEHAKTLAGQWGLTPGLVNAPDGQSEPGIVIAAKLDDLDPHQRIMLTYDEGVTVKNLVGQPFSKIVEEFGRLAGKASALVDPVTIKDPQSCTTGVNSQTPLADANPGSASLYKTGTHFSFKLKEGTRTSPPCFRLRPDWDLLREMPNILLRGQ
ncbi:MULTISPECIES: hypothetical protein [unclassified Ensifer]|uniref:hypothetical protein n=1 Tax=unclassified Ensifer TaxID=2633371 RepID=UPI0030102586